MAGLLSDKDLSGRDVALAVARAVIPVLYVVGFYACAFFLSTIPSALLMGVLVIASCAWFFVSMRIEDDDRAWHLARHAFIVKALTMPLELIAIVIYAYIAMMTTGDTEITATTWAFLIMSLYLGVLGGSIYTIGAAREAYDLGVYPRWWKITLIVCSLIPVLDLLAGMAEWFGLLRRRFAEEL